MLDAFGQAFKTARGLVADFKANEKFFLSPEYQEQEARRDFIDKFWIKLGWDVNHDRQKNPYEQEVKVERKEHGVSQRRADYAFYLRPNYRDVKFYVEAKKPHGDIAVESTTLKGCVKDATLGDATPLGLKIFLFRFRRVARRLTTPGLTDEILSGFRKRKMCADVVIDWTVFVRRTGLFLVNENLRSRRKL